MKHATTLLDRCSDFYPIHPRNLLFIATGINSLKIAQNSKVQEILAELMRCEHILVLDRSEEMSWNQYAPVRTILSDSQVESV